MFQRDDINKFIEVNRYFDLCKYRYDYFCDYSYDSDDSDNAAGEYLVDGKPYPGFKEIYDIFKLFFNQIKYESCDSDCDSDEYDSDREELDLSYTDSDLEDFCNHLNSFFS